MGAFRLELPVDGQYWMVVILETMLSIIVYNTFIAEKGLSFVYLYIIQGTSSI